MSTQSPDVLHFCSKLQLLILKSLGAFRGKRFNWMVWVWGGATPSIILERVELFETTASSTDDDGPLFSTESAAQLVNLTGFKRRQSLNTTV